MANRFIFVLFLGLFSLSSVNAQWRSYINLGYQYQAYDGYDNINNVVIAVNFVNIHENKKHSFDHSFSLYTVNVNHDFNLFAEYNPSINLKLSSISYGQMGIYFAYNLSHPFLDHTIIVGDVGFTLSTTFLDDPISMKLYAKFGSIKLQQDFADGFGSYKQNIFGLSIGVKLKEYKPKPVVIKE